MGDDFDSRPAMAARERAKEARRLAERLTRTSSERAPPTSLSVGARLLFPEQATEHRRDAAERALRLTLAAGEHGEHFTDDGLRPVWTQPVLKELTEHGRDGGELLWLDPVLRQHGCHRRCCAAALELCTEVPCSSTLTTAEH